MNIDTINFLFGLGTIGIQIAFVFLTLTLFGPNTKLKKFITTYSLHIGSLLVLGSFIGSVIYSDVLHFVPCTFCWYQRIAMFPQLVILAIAAWKRDYFAWIYARSLSIIGGLLAIYHYYGQMFNSSALPCPATGPSCSQVPFVEFGYITIPMMSLSVFAFLVVLSFYNSRNK
jgi:disulfide bond formation protein DsbB